MYRCPKRRATLPLEGGSPLPEPSEAAPPRRILVAEDDGFLRDLTTTVLRRNGFEVLSARDGEEAVETAAAEHPDLILMDVNMPNVDGLTAARRLQADPATAGIPIIFLTAHNQEKDQAAGLAAGASCYVTKPFDNRALVEAIRATLEGKKGTKTGDSH